jgi:hypothetical protein
MLVFVHIFVQAALVSVWSMQCNAMFIIHRNHRCNHPHLLRDDTRGWSSKQDPDWILDVQGPPERTGRLFRAEGGPNTNRPRSFFSCRPKADSYLAQSMAGCQRTRLAFARATEPTGPCPIEPILSSPGVTSPLFSSSEERRDGRLVRPVWLGRGEPRSLGSWANRWTQYNSITKRTRPS